MKTEKTIFTNTVVLTAGKISGDIATFLFLIYFARTFGASLFGQYAFAMSLGGFLSVLVNLGLNKLVVREISKDKSVDAMYMGNMLATQGILSIFSWCLIALVVMLTNFDSETKSIILLIGVYQILYKYSQLIGAQFRAHEDMHYSAFLEIFHKVIILLIGSLCIILWNDPVITLLIYPISAISMIMIGTKISFKKYGRPDFKIDITFIKDILSKAPPFLLLLVLTQFYDRIGVIILTAVQGDIATGIYAATDRLVITFITALGMFGAALFPVMSRLAKDAPEKLVTTYERSMRILIVSMLPVSTFVYLLSDQIITLLYGETFFQSAEVLKIMSWAILPSGLNIILVGILLATDQQTKIVSIQLKVIIGFIVSCLILIPIYSYTGLAYAKLLTSLALFFAFSWHISKTFHYSPIVKIIQAPLTSCIVSILIFKFMSGMSIWISTPSALLICAITLILTGAVKTHDIDYVRNVLTNKNL